MDKGESNVINMADFQNTDEEDLQRIMDKISIAIDGDDMIMVSAAVAMMLNYFMDNLPLDVLTAFVDHVGGILSEGIERIENEIN